ncbi:conserved putative exported protein [Yersinia pestis KIM10+]|nr:conserved putative exported protein [Yersinia pestis KIM10+]
MTTLYFLIRTIKGAPMKVGYIFAMLFSTLLLQGCVGAVVVGSAAVATKTATDPRTIGTQVDDGTLEARVVNALSKDKEIKSQTRFVVTAYQGKVLLTGQTPSAELSNRAKQIASGVDGVTEVYNEMRLGKPVDLSTASMDTWITTKVRSQLLTSDSVKSSNVKVTTENGEVFLLGLVTQQEAQSAAQIASKVSGVKHVTTAFTIVK